MVHFRVYGPACLFAKPFFNVFLRGVQLTESQGTPLSHLRCVHCKNGSPLYLREQLHRRRQPQAISSATYVLGHVRSRGGHHLPRRVALHALGLPLYRCFLGIAARSSGQDRRQHITSVVREDCGIVGRNGDCLPDLDLIYPHRAMLWNSC